MALFELTDLAALLQDDIDTATATLARTIATGLIVNATGQNIEQATYTHLLPVDADRSIRLPQRPVTAVTSVTIGGQTLTSGDQWDWDGYSDRVALDGYIPDRDTWQATVVYTAGYATVPDEIAAVALSCAARIYTQQPGVVAESIDDYRVQYADGDGTHLTGVERQILRRYRKRIGSLAPTAGRWQSGTGTTGWWTA